MANRLRQDTEEQAEPKEKKSRSSRNKGSSWASKLDAFRHFLADERTHKLFGLFLLLTALFMTVGFISNLFTWKEDMAVAGANTGWDLLTNPELKVHNWLGKTGALTALQFQNDWFGIAAFVFPFVLFLWAVRILWQVDLLPIGQSLRYSFFGLVWTSTFLGFIFHNQPSLLNYAGGYGYQLSHTFKGLFGIIGTGAVLLFSMVGFLVAAFNIPFRKPALVADDLAAEELQEETDLGAPLIEKKENNIREKDTPRTVELELNDDETEAED